MHWLKQETREEKINALLAREQNGEKLNRQERAELEQLLDDHAEYEREHNPQSMYGDHLIC